MCFSFLRSITGFCGLLLTVLIAGCSPAETVDSSTIESQIAEPQIAEPQTAKSPEIPLSAPSLLTEPTETSLPTSLTQPGDIWSRLQQTDTAYFVLMRHALAPGTGDPANFQLEDCATQRNLSEEGRSQAQRIGEAFRQRGIAVTNVFSSEWCRCLETAELMGLAVVEPFPPINSLFRDRSTETTQTEQVEQFMLSNAEASGVIIMVTHFVNIAALSGSGVGSGEMVVMRVNENEQQLEVVGALTEPF